MDVIIVRANSFEVSVTVSVHRVRVFLSSLVSGRQAYLRAHALALYTHTQNLVCRLTIAQSHKLRITRKQYTSERARFTFPRKQLTMVVCFLHSVLDHCQHYTAIGYTQGTVVSTATANSVSHN